MKFAIITHASHKIKENNIFSYEPYVREMNLWSPHTTEIKIVAPMGEGEITSIETAYNHKNTHLIPIAAFDVLSLKSTLKTLRLLPKTVYNIYKAMLWADHIHLRCPGNIGLLGCFVQILFPNKPKTAKYAGNWDPKAKQPWSYRLQKWLLSNTFLTKNMKVLVYGEWPDQSENIKPFFTASYSEKEIDNPEPVIPNHALNLFQGLLKRSTNDDSKQFRQMLNQVQHDVPISFLFIGALTKGKQPLLSLAVIQKLKEKGHQVRLDIYGEGPERGALEQYISGNDLSNEVLLHGNCDRETIKKAYQSAYFLLFISQSEGWPKVVAEAMFWGCLPVTSKVSCIPYMLANGERGALVNPNTDEIVAVIENFLQHPETYNQQAMKAMAWSRQFTMEKFEEEIGKLMSQLKKG
ncbi:MAG TPA: glycosyltransferase [Lutibacter sp.]